MLGAGHCVWNIDSRTSYFTVFGALDFTPGFNGLPPYPGELPFQQGKLGYAVAAWSPPELHACAPPYGDCHFPHDYG